MNLHLASASGNVFGYLWEDEAGPGFDGQEWARRLCPRGTALGLDGIFLLSRNGQAPWRIEHWDVDGSHTFCSNGSRAAFALLGLPAGSEREALSCGTRFRLRATATGVAIRMPEGEGFGFRPLPLDPGGPAAFGFVGNPQLVLEVPSVAEVDLKQVAPPLRHHPSIPGGTNVNVLQVLAPGRGRIRSWERGVEGETLCCGTGCAVAAAWLARRTGVSSWVLETVGGEPVAVDVAWRDEQHWRDLWLAGPVRNLGTLALGPALKHDLGLDHDA